MIRKLRCAMIVAFSIALSARAEARKPIFDIDFTKVDPKQHIKGKGRFDGVLPQGLVADFPHWNASVATGRLITEAGRKFLRLDVAKVDKRVQMMLQDCKIPAGYYQLVIEHRGASWLELLIRQGGPPYIVFWKENVKPSPKWTKTTFYLYIAASKERFKLGEQQKADASNLRFFLNPNLGVADLASIELFSCSRDEFEKQFKAAAAAKEAADQSMLIRPPADSPNFIRNSRFPLGMPSGWSIFRGSIPGEFTVKADPTETGPSGCHPLLIDGVVLRSEPFNTPDYNTGRKCVLAFFYKSAKPFKVVVIAANIDQKLKSESPLARKTMPAATKWTRGELTFPEPDSKVKCLSVEFIDADINWAAGGQARPHHGAIKLDSLQAYYGEPGRAYRSAGDCEVALAPAAAEMSDQRVQFADEPAKFKYYATGNFTGAVLKLKVVNLFGKEEALSDVPLDKKTGGELDYAVFPTAPLGQFRIEAWAERDGKRISPINELVMTRIRRPLYWGKDAPVSPFGIHVLPQKARCMKAVGINRVRLHDGGSNIKWAKLEPEKGKWNFPDREINLYREANLSLTGLLDTTPDWAADSPPKGSSYWRRYYRPKNLDDYTNYVRTVVRHYKGVIDEYLIWNEPTWNGKGNDSKYWIRNYDASVSPEARQTDSIRHFIELSKVAYTTAKQVCPEVKIAGINASRQPWVDKMLRGGAYNYCDIADFHYYPGKGGVTAYGYPGDEYEIYSAAGRKVAKIAGKPLINSECNPAHIDFNVTTEDDQSSVDDGTGIYRHSIAWKSPTNPLDIANTTAAWVMDNLSLGIIQVYLYSAHCYNFLPVRPKLLTLLGADGFPAPSYAAFSNLAWLLEDRQFVKRVPVGEKVWASVFAGRGKAVAVISGYPDGQFTVPTLPNVEALDLFGNPLTAGAKYQGHLLYLVSDGSAAQLAAQLER